MSVLLIDFFSSADQFFSLALTVSHLLIDARLKEGCKGGVDQDSIVKLSWSAGQKERLEFSWTGVMMSNTLKATNFENQVKTHLAMWIASICSKLPKG